MAQAARDASRTELREKVIPLRRARTPEVVAEILSDGTIRTRDGWHDRRERYATGSLAGRGWALWWERRLLDEE